MMALLRVTAAVPTAPIAIGWRPALAALGLLACHAVTDLRGHRLGKSAIDRPRRDPAGGFARCSRCPRLRRRAQEPAVEAAVTRAACPQQEAAGPGFRVEGRTTMADPHRGHGEPDVRQVAASRPARTVGKAKGGATGTPRHAPPQDRAG